jgi:hypothetical protein
MACALFFDPAWTSSVSDGEELYSGNASSIYSKLVNLKMDFMKHILLGGTNVLIIDSDSFAISDPNSAMQAVDLSRADAALVNDGDSEPHRAAIHSFSKKKDAAFCKIPEWTGGLYYLRATAGGLRFLDLVISSGQMEQVAINRVLIDFCHKDPDNPANPKLFWLHEHTFLSGFLWVRNNMNKDLEETLKLDGNRQLPEYPSAVVVHANWVLGKKAQDMQKTSKRLRQKKFNCGH